MSWFDFGDGSWCHKTSPVDQAMDDNIAAARERVDRIEDRTGQRMLTLVPAAPIPISRGREIKNARHRRLAGLLGAPTHGDVA